ncbi:LacI family DNA-binding transcriptional regulator [Arthrobacter sp. VKM Ac-2550]|uniref:LacI family DNA-binding transcriptional regulator n=1 Tax=Crystallibacter permensis TaxID=1938888 RepID=UPI002228094D|nr:LacI family DNA-binding transcriptional regulator [Arthrobacter sp. VKM Ac-2550]MCW2131545.1 transcriptional regulator, LacI family [Arthrobacter sp. VKM Ac-2550]
MTTANSRKGQRPTIYDVAQRAGVSKSLVSLVLTGSPLVKPDKRVAVLAAIQELGYRPNRAASTLASRQTKSIGLVIDDYRNLWFVSLLNGMQSELESQGYRVAVADARADAGPGGGAVDRFLSMRVDGLVIAMEPLDSMLQATGTPTVVAGWRDRLPEGAEFIANDDEAGGRLAAEHLLELGHRRIGHLTGTGGAATHRRSGFSAACDSAGIGFRMQGEGHGTTEEDGYQAALALLADYPGATAIFAANDTMAVGALAAIKGRGLSVPHDISVIGYDNSPLAQSRYLDLTSIDGKSEEIGVLTAQALLARIDDPSRKPQRTLVQPAAVIRGTTAPAPA